MSSKVKIYSAKRKKKRKFKGNVFSYKDELFPQKPLRNRTKKKKTVKIKLSLKNFKNENEKSNFEKKRLAFLEKKAKYFKEVDKIQLLITPDIPESVQNQKKRIASDGNNENDFEKILPDLKILVKHEMNMVKKNNLEFVYPERYKEYLEYCDHIKDIVTPVPFKEFIHRYNMEEPL